jgi:hypothetical protein
MKRSLLALAIPFLSVVCIAQDNLAQTANRFINSLTTVQQKKVQYSFTDEERFNWHFVPRTDRKGIPLEELSEQQKKGAFDLLGTCLSKHAVQNVTDVIQLENTLKQLEGRGNDDHYRDAGKYYFTIFGKPVEKGIWGWRLEGHHISFTFSADNNRIVSGTPGFLGANPAIVPNGAQKGKETLAAETDGGFTLLQSLTKEQLSRAIINEKALPEIITFDKRIAMIENPQGIKYDELNKEQQSLFIKLIQIYIHRYTKLFADDMLKDLTAAGLDKLQFAWAGSQQRQSTDGYYYRIQGPTIIIEYDNTQNNANHVHTVLRDLKHDFGTDELAEHYHKDHVAVRRDQNPAYAQQ